MVLVCKAFGVGRGGGRGVPKWIANIGKGIIVTGQYFVELFVIKVSMKLLVYQTSSKWAQKYCFAISSFSAPVPM